MPRPQAGLTKRERLMPWKALLIAMPMIMAWQYHDVKTDIQNIEGAQMAMERMFVDTQERALQGVPRGPMPQWEEPTVSAQAPEPRRIREDPADIRRGLTVVKTNQRIQYKRLDVFCLAKNIFHEAGVEDTLGRYAVAQVTLNRMQNPKYPSTVCDVVMDPWQFSWANDRSVRWTRPRGTTWEQSVAIAERVIIDGYRLQGLERANYYHADYVRPRWKKPEARIAKIGTHIFYASAR